MAGADAAKVFRTNPLKMTGIHPTRRSVVIDVRSQEEYGSGHRAGALLIPYDVIGGEIEKVAPERTTPIRLYCHSGGRAETARRKLVGMGYADVKNLGGFAAAAEKLHKNIVK